MSFMFIGFAGLIRLIQGRFLKIFITYKFCKNENELIFTGNIQM